MFIGRIIADSPGMKAILATVDKVAASTSSVLVYGETGVGKGLIAKVLHRESHRADRPFIPLNCGALTEQLLESELFGHERGSFTGAIAQKPGLFEVANDGTLFLDEISEMSHGMQTRLLQVLDSGEMRRVGGTQLKRVDVRIVAATNKNLEREVRAGRFRDDLLFRLNVIPLRIPPLRRRREDIPGLVDLYLARFRPPGRTPKKVAAETLQTLLAHPWPGNVRELANTIERAILLAPGETIGPQDILARLESSEGFEPEPPGTPPPLAETERLAILRALEHTGGNKAAAARILDINVKTLSRKIRTYETSAEGAHRAGRDRS